MRTLYFLLLASCGAAGLAILMMVLTLAFSTEPVLYTWATDRDENSAGGFAVAGEGELRPACAPISLEQPMINYRTVAEFATEAVIAVNTFDYLDWDRQIPEALGRYFTPRAGRIYLYQFERSTLLDSIRDNYYTVSALSLRPALVVSEVDIPGEREWTVQVPVRLYYQTGVATLSGGRTDATQDQVFTVTITERPPTDQNYRGVGVRSIANTRIRQTDELDRLR